MATDTLQAILANEQQTSEQWREVEGYPGYRVSTSGRVQTKRHRNGLPSPAWRNMKPVLDGHGYPQVRLHRKGDRPQWHFVSRLVLTAFSGPPTFPGAVVRHYLNNDPLDNRIENLQWGTQEQNCQDKRRHGTYQEGPRHWRSIRAARNLHASP